MPKFLWQKPKPIKNTKPNMTFDTETIDGRAFLISDNSGNRCVNDREFKDLNGLLEYLTHKSYRQTVNWFYNLEYDTNAIIHRLSFNDRVHIAEMNWVDYEDYRIEIIPKKLLKIGKIKDNKIINAVSYFDLAQFYNYIPLKILAEKTNYNKVDVNDIAHININKYYDNEQYRDHINDRCVYDCKITKELADIFTNNIQKVVKINKYISNASIARRYVLENIKRQLRMPTLKLLDCALQSYHAGHIETCALGSYTNIRNYDIRSAYPAVTANLYETSGAPVHNKEYEPDMAYSFYNINVDYYDEYLSPMWFTKSNRNYHTNGKWDTWVTQSEIDYLIRAGHDFKILDAHHIRKSNYTLQPFNDLINDLYQERLKAKENKDEIQLVYKIILNSIYGVTLNTIHKKLLSEIETDIFEIKDGNTIYYDHQYIATNMYNPVYGTYITASTRSKLFMDFHKYLKYILSINTDGVYLTHKVPVNLSKRLGDYSYKKLPEYILMGSGRYFIKNNGIVDSSESRFRSIPKNPQEIYELFKNHLNNEKISISREKPIKLKESIKQKKNYRYNISSFPIQQLDLIDNFNVFRKVSKQISFHNNSRYWYGSIDTPSELFDTQISSRPFDVGEIDTNIYNPINQ